MITIGQLADYVGVTVRAIRHYHQCGLLPEPPRDASGYRRYTASDAVALIKIATLADAGVPVARIGELLAVDAQEFTTAIAEIDQNLRNRMSELRRTRRRIAGLTGGDRLVVPSDLADYLDRLRAIGVSDRYVEMERDGWILIRTAAPDQVSSWITAKRAALDDDKFRRLCIDYGDCFDWSEDDPRLEDLADRMVAWAARHYTDGDSHPAAGVELDPSIHRMIEASITDSSPAWRRLDRLIGRTL